MRLRSTSGTVSVRRGLTTPGEPCDPGANPIGTCRSCAVKAANRGREAAIPGGEPASAAARRLETWLTVGRVSFTFPSFYPSTTRRDCSGSQSRRDGQLKALTAIVSSSCTAGLTPPVAVTGTPRHSLAAPLSQRPPLQHGGRWCWRNHAA